MLMAQVPWVYAVDVHLLRFEFFRQRLRALWELSRTDARSLATKRTIFNAALAEKEFALFST
jgi:hypothetical protein